MMQFISILIRKGFRKWSDALMIHFLTILIGNRFPIVIKCNVQLVHYL